jgi:hypothetical protein
MHQRQLRGAIATMKGIEELLDAGAVAQLAHYFSPYLFARKIAEKNRYSEKARAWSA